VLAVALVVIGLLTWGLRRIGNEIGTTPPPRRRQRRASRLMPSALRPGGVS
jgi:uncharacterized protein HemY